MIFREFNKEFNRVFEVEVSPKVFKETKITDLKKGSIIRIKQNGRFIQKERMDYQHNKVNQFYKTFEVVTPPYKGIDNENRVGVIEETDNKITEPEKTLKIFLKKLLKYFENN